jgi:hypothetical protein
MELSPLYEICNACRYEAALINLRGAIFCTFSPGKFLGEILRKITPPKKKKMLGQIEFSAENVSKNLFSRKFRRIFRGK